MLHRHLTSITCLFLTAFLFLTPRALLAEGELDKLIDDLFNVAEPGVGYSASFSGSSFLPYADSEQLGTFVIGGTRRSESETLRKIVARGAAAVPALLEHLSDARKIRMEPLRGMEWMGFSDAYDYNARTGEKIPPGDIDTPGGKKDYPGSHAITVGDMCFVALGQIVNRNYNATRYQPSGGLIVISPTYSRRLRDRLIANWSHLTVEKHRRLLIEDFQNPDHEYRRIGAYQRLCFYYPDAVEPLVLKVLNQPTFDVLKIRKFFRDTLYRAKPKERKQRYDAFIRKHGSQYTVGVMEKLFDDLDRTEYSTQARELLITLFYKPATVTSSDRPLVRITSDAVRARFISSLIHDESRRVGNVVKQIFIKHSRDAYLAPACLRCLASRGYDAFLVEQFNVMDYATHKFNLLHYENLKAIATARSHVVRERLLRVIKETLNDMYFTHALSGLGNVEDKLVWDNATRILSALPGDTGGGSGILELIAKRFPDKAEALFRSFLSNGNAQRANTMCEVLWYYHPLSPRILAPLLDDKRKLSGFSIPMRVCDRAAQAISHTAQTIKFDEEWPQPEKDAAILKLKEYCKNRQ